MKMRKTVKLTATTLAAACGLILAAGAADENPAQLPPAAAKPGLTYAADIKPILDQSCVKCHSGDKPKAHLKLDNLADALKGSKDGKVIIPGDSAKSMLVLAAAHATKDHDQWMPPPHNRAGAKNLTPEQIGLIRAWIDQGAK